MQSSRKDILFFSNYCDYCTDLLNTLIKKNIKTEFMLVCVDNNRYNLPAFVDRVPIIFTRNDDILYDESIMKYIEGKYPTESMEISPFSLHQPSYGNHFSFLEETNEMHTKGYTILGMDQKISSPVENEDSKKGKFDSSVLDKYLQSRDMDEQNFKRIMNGGR